jgi:hypothetical protein|tara:strand:- start:466 stop:609 length:144 start_codon:yes stop_codon:yes gene_type:complete
MADEPQTIDPAVDGEPTEGVWRRRGHLLVRVDTPKPKRKTKTGAGKG